MAEQQVTAPDQRKPTNIKLARIVGIGAILLLLSMLIGNHEGWVENVYLVGLAAIIAAIIGVDAVLRRNGIRR